MFRSCASKIVFAGCLLLSATASAADFYTKDRIEFPADQSINDDVYVATDELVLDGTIDGDLVAIARIIRINGTVTGDAMLAAQAIVIDGQVQDDLRTAGQVLKLGKQAKIGDDLIAAGFSLEVEPGAQIGGEVRYAGYQGDFGGEISETLTAAVANARLSGSVGDKVEMDVGVDAAGPQAYAGGSPPPIAMPTVPPGLTVTDSANVGGMLIYRSPREAKISEDATIAGEVKFRQQVAKPPAPPTVAERVIHEVKRYLILAIVGAVFLLVAPRWTSRLTSSATSRPFVSLLGGLGTIVAFIAALIAGVLLIIIGSVFFGAVQLPSLIPVLVIIGLLGLAVLIALFCMFVFYLGYVIFAVALGRWITRSRGESLWSRLAAMLLGLLLVVALLNIPYAGPFIAVAIVLIGLGTVLVGAMFRLFGDKSDAAGARA